METTPRRSRLKGPSITLAEALLVVLVVLGAAGFRGDKIGAPGEFLLHGVKVIGKGMIDAGGRARAMVREVTAYNVGVPEQTSDAPCIGASGDDLCARVEKGERICAANFVALGTVLRIEGIGECVVLDRMHRRFANRVDVAMKEDEVGLAREFGVRRLVVLSPPE